MSRALKRSWWDFLTNPFQFDRVNVELNRQPTSTKFERIQRNHKESHKLWMSQNTSNGIKISSSKIQSKTRFTRVPSPKSQVSSHVRSIQAILGVESPGSWDLPFHTGSQVPCHVTWMLTWQHFIGVDAWEWC